MKEPEQLPKVLGANARRLRLEAGATLEQMAGALRGFGVRWSTGRVGDLESGRVAVTFPTVIAVIFALSQLLRREVSMSELFDHNEPIEINDQLTLHDNGLSDLVAGKPLTSKQFGFNRTRLQAVFDGMRAEHTRMSALASKYGDISFDLAQRAGRESGLAEYRAADDLGVTVGTVAQMACYMWRRTFTEERDRRAGPDASPQKLGQVTRKMKAELRAELEELRGGND